MRFYDEYAQPFQIAYNDIVCLSNEKCQDRHMNSDMSYAWGIPFNEDALCHGHCCPKERQSKKKCNVLTLVNAKENQRNYITLKFAREGKNQ